MRKLPCGDSIHFVAGIFFDETVGIFGKSENRLLIINDKYLPKIIKYLRTLFSSADIVNIKLSWYGKQ